jgi:hypothetical protein
MSTARLLEVDRASGVSFPRPRFRREFLDIDADAFRAGFDRKPFLIGHSLTEHPLLDAARLVELAKRLPEEHVEYNAGDLPVSLDPALTPRTGLSIEETIRRIEECRSWMVLKYVERDPDYKQLLDDCLDQIQVLSEPLAPGMCARQGFIFVSSPGAVTPYHMDHEYNFLLQVRGRKTVSMFDVRDRSILSEQELERTYSRGSHRNLEFKDEYQQKAAVFELTPGLGLHFPVTAPHWVKNGEAVSVSFSITFRTPASDRRGSVYRVNSWLRGRGIAPLPFGRSPARDSLKFQAARVARRARHLVAGGR